MMMESEQYLITTIPPFSQNHHNIIARGEIVEQQYKSLVKQSNIMGGTGGPLIWDNENNVKLVASIEES